MDEYERVAARLNNDTEGSISDIAAILRESFPQSEAGGELDEAWRHYHYEPFVGDPLNPDDKERVRRHGEACKKAFRAGFLAARPAPTAEKGQDEKNKTALLKINDIRNSIIGFQKINWSEHIYPLVAALDEAGIEGMGYPKAREYYGSLMERCNKAEAALEGLREALDAIDFYINNGDALPKNKSDPYYAADAAIEVFRAAILAREAPKEDTMSTREREIWNGKVILSPLD